MRSKVTSDIRALKPVSCSVGLEGSIGAERHGDEFRGHVTLRFSVIKSG
jgi:hypothetical protein